MSAIPATIDALDLLARLRRAQDRFADELNRCRAIAKAWQKQSFGEINGWRFGVAHQAIGPGAGDAFDVMTLPNGRTLVFLADCGSKATPSACLTGLVVRRAIVESQTIVDIRAGQVLSCVNRELLTTEISPLAMAVIILPSQIQQPVELARAGLPPPLRLTRDGSTLVYPTPGPLLGVSATDYVTDFVDGQEGDRWVLSSVAEFSLTPHAGTNQDVAEQLIGTVPPHIRPTDDRTILLIGR